MPRARSASLDEYRVMPRATSPPLKVVHGDDVAPVKRTVDADHAHRQQRSAAGVQGLPGTVVDDDRPGVVAGKAYPQLAGRLARAARVRQETRAHGTAPGDLEQNARSAP